MRVWRFSPFRNSSQNICLSSKTPRVLFFKAFISMTQNTPQTIVILSQEHGQHDSSPGTLTQPVQGETQLTQRTDYYQGPVRDCGLLQELGPYFKHSYFVFLNWEQEWKELSAKGIYGVCWTGQNQKILTFASVKTSRLSAHWTEVTVHIFLDVTVLKLLEIYGHSTELFKINSYIFFIHLFFSI